MTTAPNSGPEDEPSPIEVTIRTPAGASHQFNLRPDELVVTATASAVEHFVKAKELAPDDYGLALIRSGEAEAMLDTSEIRAYSVVAGDVLHLVVEKPQVDG
jgi:hypothetical protein